MWNAPDLMFTSLMDLIIIYIAAGQACFIKEKYTQYSNISLLVNYNMVWFKLAMMF